MERYMRIAFEVQTLAPAKFVDIHNCGYPDKRFPVNLCCEMLDGTTIYIGQGFGGRNVWSVDFSYDPNMKTRSKMKSINGIRTERSMLEIVQAIIERKISFTSDQMND